MKNNEILISVCFEDNKKERELSFLVIKDITLKSLVEAVYFGLKKHADAPIKSDEALTERECFDLLKRYIKTHKELVVLYNSNGDHDLIDFTQKCQDGSEYDGKYFYEMPLNALGIVTSSCLYFTSSNTISKTALFKSSSSYIVKEKDNLEYNISSRRLNVIEESNIEIIPPNELPSKSSNSFLDVIIPVLISLLGMGGIRILCSKLTSSATMNDSMMIMMIAMPMVSGITTIYNYNKQKRQYRVNIEEWKANYENYIARKIQTIIDWQDNDITYLNSVYPDMKQLFYKTSEIDSSIFSRSQNDKDFMKISLGKSQEVEPLFKIESVKKDSIFYDVYYQMKKGTDDQLKIEIILPENVDPNAKKKKKKKTTDQVIEENKNKYLLTDLPYNFANKGVDGDQVIGFNYLRSDKKDKNGQYILPPLLLDLKSCGALGVISDDLKMSHDFIRHVIFELAYYHSPEDLQMVFFFDEEEDEMVKSELVKNYKYLPHTNELFENMSQFVFDKASAGNVFGRLLSIMNERKRSGKSAEDGDLNSNLTQIVCVVFYDYDIKETGFSKYLPEVPEEGKPYKNDNGLTFIFIQKYKDMLPKYCGSIINLDKNIKENCKLSMRYNILNREQLKALSEDNAKIDGAATTDSLIEFKHFQNEYMFENYEKYDKQFETAYRQLSAIYYTRIAENGKVPSMVTLFELYGYNSKMVADGDIVDKIRNNWKDIKKNDVTRNLKIPLGKNEHGLLYLDLHEKADGPHMLEAGTTGSGKSETIITYLIGLCMKYSPMDLNIMLVDMKGGGFSDRLGDLPHCVGAVTNTTGESEGISAVYMLKRFLESLNAEIKKRMLILSELGVDNADAYIRAARIIKQIKAIENDPTRVEEKETLINQIKNNNMQMEALRGDVNKIKPLSHLVLVVDEFTELKRFSSESNDIDFIAEITTIARVGRTLGLHIILISQNIEGAITDDIRVNSKSKICLKVATKQASKEMLGTVDAAAATMPGNGRAYLLVGTGSRYEYFQSAYTGANKNMDIEAPVNLTKVPESGQFETDYYISSKDNSITQKRNKNVSEYDTQLKYITDVIKSIQDEFDIPVKIFRDPLKSVMMDKTEWEGIENDR
ncbi:MAG: FtsK/SpoIIIE domain-containing protein [Agathobacter sp.]|nr:FtsK/SpoIIIE domain-containing protein [Agathobacter sp.]